MIKAPAGGRELHRLAVIVALTTVAILAVPVLRLFDARQTSQELQVQKLEIDRVRDIRTQSRNILEAVTEGAAHPDVDTTNKLEASLQSMREVHSQAHRDGIRFVADKFDPVFNDVVKNVHATLSLPQDEWNGKVDYLANAILRLGVMLDSQIENRLTIGSEQAKNREESQRILLMVALLGTVALAGFLFIPNFKAVSEAFQDLERRREEAGKKATERGAILSATTYAVLVADADGLIRSANPAAGNMFRSIPEEIVGRRLEGLLGGQANNLVAAASEGKAVEAELRTMRLDGSDAPVAVSLTPMDGEGYLAIVRDLSDREAVQRLLVDEQARTRSLLESIPDAIVRLDEVGVVTEYRPVPDLDFDPTSGALAGRTFEDVIPPSAIPSYRRARAATVTEASAAFVFTTVLQGRERHVEARLAPMPEGGELVLLRDVTERDEALLGLRRSEQALAASQSAAGMGSWDVNLATGRISFSQGLRELLDLGPDDVEGAEAVLNRAAPDDRETLRDALSQSLEANRARREVVRPHASIRPAERRVVRRSLSRRPPGRANSERGSGCYGAASPGSPACRGAGSRRAERPGQERVPGKYEPRDPHADERHHRRCLSPPGDRAEPSSADVRRHDSEERREPIDACERRSRSLEDRERQDDAGAERVFARFHRP
ncbi:PAS domain S-box protein [bacterium]|nr:MAG: PAS domain S-box protein [bacterium]